MKERRFTIVSLVLVAMLLLMVAALTVANPLGAATATPEIDAGVMEWADRTETITATWSPTTTVSGPVYLNGLAVVGFVMASTWDAADLTFQMSVDGTTYNNVYDDDDNEYTVQASASRYVLVEPVEMRGVRWLQVRSGTSGTPVTQTLGTGSQVVEIVVMPGD